MGKDFIAMFNKMSDEKLCAFYDDAKEGYKNIDAYIKQRFENDKPVKGFEYKTSKKVFSATALGEHLRNYIDKLSIGNPLTELELENLKVNLPQVTEEYQYLKRVGEGA